MSWPSFCLGFCAGYRLFVQRGFLCKTAPTLILWEEQDALFPREEQERLATKIPDATLKVYPESGHAAHWERPEEVVRDLEAFMKSTRPAQ
jgi:pimeloyl-ACP methyl ester carboxylesterase